LLQSWHLSEADELASGSNPPTRILNLGFLVSRMTPAARAKLFNGKLFSLALFVLGRHVIAPFTPVAL
jgi:hypothetical protein